VVSDRGNNPYLLVTLKLIPSHLFNVVMNMAVQCQDLERKVKRR